MKTLFTVISALKVNQTEDQQNGQTVRLPEWYLLFPDGWNEIEGEGKYLIDAKAWDMVQAGISRRGLEIVFDYEHQSVKGGQAPAAGWCKDWRYTPGKGIEAKIAWNEEAAAYLAKKQYRYYSPVFYVQKSDQRLAGVHSVALTNTPKTNHLKPLLAKLGAQQQQEEFAMLEQLIALLGLAEGATEADVIAAIENLLSGTGEVVAVLGLGDSAEMSAVVASIQTLKDGEQIPGQVVTVLDLEGTPDVSTVVASINALKQAPKGMVSKADFNALEMKIAKRDADEAVDGAIQAGKITPDQKDWATKYAKDDLAGFNTFVAKAPVVIPLKKLPDGEGELDQTDLDETTLQVASLMGVTQEDLKQYGGTD